MRSKAPLAMMEQMVMLLVFALAAALCLQAFVKSDQMSKRMEAQDGRPPCARAPPRSFAPPGGTLSWRRSGWTPWESRIR